MKKAEFVALGISEELAAKAEKASLEELKGYVEKSNHDEAVEESKTLKAQVAERDKQLETLKASAGDNEELKKQIETLQTENTAAKEKHEAEMKDLKLTTAIKLAVAGKVHDEEIAAGLFDRTKLVLGTDGKVAGLDEQLKNLQKEKAFLFKEDASGAGSGAGAPGAPGRRRGGFYKPRNGETHEDSYASQFAKERNEADKNSSKGSLWGEE
ncbi:hypothetical protein D7X87_22935 [bacterium D16-54]|nr:hypothetical protein D7X87_22935 [bacterium D16-54]RKJ10494.1 hypothetical protein D7X65_23335 [bacterium D16-56]